MRSPINNYYRPDIDGLRALAILPVVFFHAGIAFFPGGFVGVDIFFVISGYLITNILLKDIGKQEFSVVQFYNRRIRRIFPALFFVLFSSTVFALWILLPSELENFGESLTAASLFYSNYHFMFDSNYFSAAAETKPLLHMWSLAVEEQFYIIFPIFLYLITKYAPRNFGYIVLGVFIFSLLFSVFLVAKTPDYAFYSTAARAWELMVGSLIAIFPRSIKLKSQAVHILSLSGLAMICYSVFFFSDSTVFPGFNALFPCFGAALILYTGNISKQTFVSKLLSNPAFRFIGLISFSLYLWHWPILVYYQMYSTTPLSNTEVLTIIIASILLATLSWKFVEEPFRTNKRWLGKFPLFIGGSGLIVIGVLVGFSLFLLDGLPDRFTLSVHQILGAKKDVPKRTYCSINALANNDILGCTIGDKEAGEVSFVVWGDSHGAAILPAIDKSAKNSDKKGVYIGAGGCIPLLGTTQVRQGYESCPAKAEALIEYLNVHLEVKQVLLVSRWAIYAMGERFLSEKGHTVYIKDDETVNFSLDENKRVFEEALEKTIKQLHDMERDIIIVNQVPELTRLAPETAARALVLGQEIDLRTKRSQYDTRQEFVLQQIQKNQKKYQIKIIDPASTMCDKDYCIANDKEIPIYRDTNHLTKSYALKLSSIFDIAFTNSFVPN